MTQSIFHSYLKMYLYAVKLNTTCIVTDQIVVCDNVYMCVCVYNKDNIVGWNR